jgi:hypothetical protein
MHPASSGQFPQTGSTPQAGVIAADLPRTSIAAEKAEIPASAAYRSPSAIHVRRLGG